MPTLGSWDCFCWNLMVSQYFIITNELRPIENIFYFYILCIILPGDTTRLPDTESVGEFTRRNTTSDRVLKYVILQRDSREYCFLKQKVYFHSEKIIVCFCWLHMQQGVSVAIAAPPPPAGIPIPSSNAGKLREGWLRKKKEGKQWKRRYVKLMEHMLTYWKSPVIHTVV